MPTLSLKAYLYGGLLILLIGLFSYWTINERHQQAIADAAADHRTVLVAEAKDIAIEAATQAAFDKGTQVYEKVVSIPAVGDLGVVCESPHANPVPGPATGKGGITGPPVVVPGNVFDPSGELLTIARSNDALVRDLQAQVAALRAAMALAAQAHK